MNLPFDYDRVTPGPFGDPAAPAVPFDRARVAIVPVPWERVGPTRSPIRGGPQAILAASAQLEFWDEEMECDASRIGICTLPEMELPYASAEQALAEIRRVAAELIGRDKFPVFLGGEHAITGPVVAALAQRFSGLSVLQIDAHADLRDTCQGSPHHRTCAMRRVLEYARATQVGIRSLSPEEAAAAPTLPTEIFYDFNMRSDENWIERIVDSLSETVYITLDVDGLEPATMPATLTPEPGGLSWYELLALLRRVVETRNVVGFDVVELAPLPGQLAPDVLCARLVYKLLGYRFGDEVRAR